jgi:hypothetical protein
VFRNRLFGAAFLSGQESKAVVDVRQMLLRIA